MPAERIGSYLSSGVPGGTIEIIDQLFKQPVVPEFLRSQHLPSHCVREWWLSPYDAAAARSEQIHAEADGLGHRYSAVDLAKRWDGSAEMFCNRPAPAGMGPVVPVVCSRSGSGGKELHVALGTPSPDNEAALLVWGKQQNPLVTSVHQHVATDIEIQRARGEYSLFAPIEFSDAVLWMLAQASRLHRRPDLRDHLLLSVARMIEDYSLVHGRTESVNVLAQVLEVTYLTAPAHADAITEELADVASIVRPPDELLSLFADSCGGGHGPKRAIAWLVQELESIYRETTRQFVECVTRRGWRRVVAFGCSSLVRSGCEKAIGDGIVEVLVLDTLDPAIRRLRPLVPIIPPGCKRLSRNEFKDSGIPDDVDAVVVGTPAVIPEGPYVEAGVIEVVDACDAADKPLVVLRGRYRSADTQSFRKGPPQERLRYHELVRWKLINEF